MELSFTPRGVTRILVIVVCVLGAAHLAGVWSSMVLGHDRLMGLIPLFSLNHELNIPTFFSGLAMLSVAALLGVVAAARRRAAQPYRVWAFLSVIALFLAYDEVFSVHEHLNVPFRDAFSTSGILYLAWVIPYAVLALAVGVAGFRTVLGLPRDIRIRVFAAGALYVVGAVGFEMLGAPRWAGTWGINDVIYQFYSFAEEMLEMIGMVTFIHAMLLYVEYLNVRFRFGVPAAR